jgi:ectoine hydroxylase-related dioxygenase (phytanoyl-CoA dioxygenase family)
MNLDQDGYAMVRNALDEVGCERLRDVLEEMVPGAHGVRNLLEIPQMAELAQTVALPLVAPILGSNARVVRGIFFDKLPGANWKVPWHQDLTIAVRERIETPGYSGWSIKEGVIHVRSPTDILEQMLTVRLHLDDCPADNGPLKVIPGTHRMGRLTREQVSRLSSGEPVICEASAGDALLMRPLLLHASAPSVSPRHRRVLHIEFAAGELPLALHWAAAR